MSTWNKLTLRDSTEEEKEVTGYQFQWDGATPELFERVLVIAQGLTTDEVYIDEVYIDEWFDFDDGQGFYYVDVGVCETVYWTSIPEFDLEG